MLDLAIIGGGPAGLTAGLYATRGGLKDVVMFEMGMPGGQITSSSEVENYPGQLKVVTGMDLMQDWAPQAMQFGLKHEMDSVDSIRKVDNHFVIKCSSGKEFLSLSVIVATGSVPKKGGFGNEDKFFGRGISTCATCDGFFYRKKDVAVIGGGDAALEEAHYLSKICKKVYIFHRRDTFRAAPSTVERVQHTENIELILNSNIISALGDNSGVTGIEYSQNSETKSINLDGIFVFVGRTVKNDMLKLEDGSFICDVSSSGEIVVDLSMKTDVAGLFAAGDVRISASRQVVCAAGDGATAALSAISYVDSQKTH
jgi:thioredoxin reductase (NADPH)